MSNNDIEFVPEQVERQIDLLAHVQKGRVDVPSDARLISDLYHVYAKNQTTVERAWQRLSTQVENTRPLTTAGSGSSQYLWQPHVLPERRERPQGMEIKVTQKRPPRPITRFLEMCAAIVVVAALVLGTIFLLNNAHHQTPSASTASQNSGLYVSTSYGVSRRDLASGKVLWSYRASQQETVASDIYVMDNVVIFQIDLGSSLELVGVDASTGQQLWTQTSAHTQPSWLETVSNGVAIVFTYTYDVSQRSQLWVSTITAYRATTGQRLWSDKLTPPADPQSVTSEDDRFALANGVFYLSRVLERAPTFSPSLSQVLALQVASGTPIWQKTISSNVVPLIVADENRLYFIAGKMVDGMQRYECFALTSANGNQVWQKELADDAGYISDVGFSPTVANGVLYIGSLEHSLTTDASVSHIYTYNASNGTLLKSYTLGAQDGFNFPPLVIQNLILYNESAGNSPGIYNVALIALDIKTGKPAWSAYVGPTSTVEPQIVNAIIYARGGDKIFAYSASGKLLHSYQVQTSPDAGWTFTVVA